MVRPKRDLARPAGLGRDRIHISLVAVDAALEAAESRGRQDQRLIKD